MGFNARSDKSWAERDYCTVEDRAAIVRSVDGRAVEGRAERQTYVQPGDVITIFERRF